MRTRGNVGVFPQLGSGSGEKIRPIAIAETKPFGKQADRFEARRSAKTAFHIADRTSTDTGAFGQFLLAQPSGVAESPNELCKL